MIQLIFKNCALHETASGCKLWIKITIIKSPSWVKPSSLVENIYTNPFSPEKHRKWKKNRSKKKKFCFKELIFQNEVQLVNSFKAYISHKTEREETDERQKWMETLLQILMVSIVAAIFRQGIWIFSLQGCKEWQWS